MSRYALVIGISQYEYLAPLKKPAAGATEVARLLREYGDFEVEFFPRNWNGNSGQVSSDIEVSIDTFLDILSEFKERVKGHTALFYFSGHGFLTKDRADRHHAYLAMTGSQVQPKGKFCIPQNTEHISLDELGTLFLKSCCNQLIVWLDCCHSGAMMDAGFLQEALARSTNDGCDYSLMTACRNFESAYEGGPEAPYTMFTGNLVQALEREIDPRGTVSSGVLYDSVFRALKGSGQEPRGMNLGRPISLVTYPGRVQVSTDAPVAGKAMGIGLIGVNPYRGLEAFQEADADLFFGRETAIGNLLRRLLTNRFLAVVGSSGSGKSSLVMAGLIPKLKREDSIPGSESWAFLTVRPAQQPASVLLEQLGAIDATIDQLVLIDQFEEVFTVWDGAARSALMALINGWLAEGAQVRVVITMRAEFLDLCHDSAIVELINQSRNLYIVQPLTAAEIEAAIVMPALRHGATVEVGLASVILTQVLDQPGILPLLQYTLQELWGVCIEAGDSDRWQLKLVDYERLGGVTGSLNARAEGLFQALPVRAQQLLPRIFVEALVQSGEESAESPLFVRQSASWGELGVLEALGAVHGAIDPFVEARLLVSGERVEVAHEAILTKWERLLGWLMASREPLRLRKKLAVEYHDWVQYGRSESEMLQGALLEGVLEKVNLEGLPEEQRAFVVGSRERRDRLAHREVEQERALRKLAEESARSERQGKLVAIASAGVVGVFAILAGLLWRNAALGEINALLSKAQAQFGENRSSLDSLVSALKVEEKRRQSIWVKFDPKLKTDALQVLQQASYWVRESNRLEGNDSHKNYVQSVSFNPRGGLIATASFDKTVKLWDLQGHLKYTLPHDAEVTQVVFHPTQNLIMTGSLDKTVRLWDFEGKPIGAPIVNSAAVRSISFDPNTQTIATACQNGVIHFWNLQGKLQSGFLGSTQKPWKPHGKERINSIDFSPDGKVLAVADKKGVIKIWDRQGRELIPLKGYKPGKSINRIRFSPDGSTIATASENGTVILWDTKTGMPKITLAGQKYGINDIVFHPTKFSSEQNPVLTTATIATANLDGTVSLWNSQGKLMETLSGHSSRVNSVSFSPDGNFLVSASNDKIPRLWRVNNLALDIIAAHEDKVFDIAISSHKQAIASNGMDGVKLFNQERNSRTWPTDFILESANNINSDRILLFGENPNGRIRILDWTGDQKGADIPTTESVRYVSFIDQNNIGIINFSDKAQIWNSNKKEFQLFGNEKSSYHKIRFSQDGKLIAIIDNTGVIEVYDASKKLLHRIKTSDVGIKDLRFTFDNKQIVVAGQTGNLSIWGLDGKYSPPFGSSNATISRINFRPNGDIISASDDKTAVLWSPTGQLITKFVGHTGPVNSTVFSTDGETLVTASSDGKIIVWHDINQKLDIEKQYSEGCRWLKDYLGLRKKKLDLCH